ncbi:4-diphosphocytidyl-2-C-methyl-D-erythritol kinase [Maioricimonas rarisocia]|uniref:4-diphosphocytidyl-2-C-methyl-D-erythritol kinase n=1 Tax=Maioricimonas rarisocia TaxID=2528026 RepID=A0A517Z8P6_9PLAN|nr:4-(cytidine 5'-diphospho)-2-C-methyl-D-erythritol kinase [Maioricimonas rarisocia]QDU38857.1 4-diphosphocytidyl-2-C-methyl-D-erythritol kinase [Maioricimonas rarisocia]
MRFRQHGPSLVVQAPAKLNLFLEVLGKRPDGYHELETVMVSIGLHDTLRFEPDASGGISLSCQPAGEPAAGRGEPTPSLSTGSDNLICRAAAALKESTGCSQGARIALTKRIPMEAGLGGGSSDAAATLVALNRLWSLDLPSTELHQIAAGLGSDLNFFIDSPALAVCRGRGEQIEPVPLGRPLHLVVVRPREGLSTAAVFREWQSQASPRSSAQLLEMLKRGDLGQAGTALHNALQTPAEELSEQVRNTLRAIGSMESVGAAMSGSGTACFAICRNGASAHRIGARLRAQGLGRVFVVSTGL